MPPEGHRELDHESCRPTWKMEIDTNIGHEVQSGESKYRLSYQY